MITRLFTRQLASQRTVAHVCQVACSITGALVMVLGFRRLADLELTEQQPFTDTVATLLLSGVFAILSFVCHVWRQAVGHFFASGQPHVHAYYGRRN